jgi:cold shock CspA family protein
VVQPHCGLRLYFATPRRQGCVCAYQAVQKAAFNSLAEDAKVAFNVVEYRANRRKTAGEVRIEVRTLVAIMIMVLMATSLAFARKASQHHSKPAAPNHQTTTKADPGGVARDPADVELDRKIGSICRGC